MEVVDGLFDGQSVLLKDQSKIPLEEIRRGRIELHPYLLFPVKVEQTDGSLEEEGAAILYPHTVDRDIDKSQLVYGEKRPTRILHYIPYGQAELIRKPDLRHPHTVKMLGYRELVLELKDGSEISISFDGNCYDMPKEIKALTNGQEKRVLEAFFDRPSELANIIKKAGIEVYSK